MRTVSLESLVAHEAKAETAFVVKLGKVLRDAVPDLADVPAQAFLAQVRLLIEQARSYGLMSEQEIGSFAVTAGLLGVNFVDAFPGAREILEGDEPSHRKAELLEAFTLNLFDILEGS